MLTSEFNATDLLWDVIAGLDECHAEQIAIRVPIALCRRIKQFADCNELRIEDVMLAMVNRHFGEPIALDKPSGEIIRSKSQ